MPEWTQQGEWEREFLAWAAQLNDQHVAHLRQVLATGGPAAVKLELAGVGLSQGALQVAAATIDQRGFDGAAQLVQERLQEVATHNQIEAAAQSPEWQDRAAKFLNENGVKADGQSPVHQAAQIHLAAKAQGVDPTVIARRLGRMQDPAEQAAEAERQHGAKAAEKNEALAGRQLQAFLGEPAFHKAASAAGMPTRAFMKELIKYSDKPEEAVKRFPSLFTGADEALVREVLGGIAAADLHDRFLDRMIEKDGGAAQPYKPNDDSWRADIAATVEKLTPKALARPASDLEKKWRGQDLTPGTKANVGDSWGYHLEMAHRKVSGESLEGIEAPPRLRAELARTNAQDLREKASAGDTWRDHLSASYDRAKAGEQGEAALAEHDQARSSTLAAARNLDNYADAAERDDP